ncbi:MAG: ABC transporter permease [Burkholderiales bacterium]|nr:ABC transporter permease [Burkholderiales bacterium]
MHERLTRWAVVVLLILLAASLLAPVLPIGRPDQIGYGTRLSPPSWLAPFGCDQLGRPVLARVLQGIQTTFLLSTVAVLVAGALGALVAMATTYGHPTADEVASRGADILFSFPPILLGILVVAVIAPGMLSAMVVIAFITFPTMLRVIRAATLSVMKRDFVVVAEIVGVSFPRRLLVHILPNVVEAFTVQIIYSISVGMIVESGLSFLGIGVQPPLASLGSLLRDGLPYIEVAPWLTLGPGLTLAAAIMAVNLLGDGLRRVVDPASRA